MGLTEEIAEQYDDFQKTLEVLEKGEKYLNYGFTLSRAEPYEVRQKRLCLEVFKAAEIAPGHTVVDVGFGSGEQDFLLAANFPFRNLIGYNIAKTQVDYANDRARSMNLHKRLSFIHGRAEEMPGMAESSADRVVAIECAFYFERHSFYREAARILKKGGLLVLADITFSDRIRILADMGEDKKRVGYFSANREQWERYFTTRSVQDIRKYTRPGAQMTVFQILKNMRHGLSRGKKLTRQRKTWLKMALSSQIVALGLLTGLIRYDIIVLQKR